MDEKCGTCRFWNKVFRDCGKCRRYPPSSVVGELARFSYPETMDGDVCGEYQPKAERNPVHTPEPLARHPLRTTDEWKALRDEEWTRKSVMLDSSGDGTDETDQSHELRVKDAMIEGLEKILAKTERERWQMVMDRVRSGECWGTGRVEAGSGEERCEKTATIMQPTPFDPNKMLQTHRLIDGRCIFRRGHQGKCAFGVEG